MDVIQYIFFNDGLYKYVKDAPTPRTQKKKDGESNNDKPASDFLELLLVATKNKNDQGKKIEILLDPGINLYYCKKYLWDLMEID